ncbi:MAG TPA: HAD family hydrolase [Bryobacteraceae bacterium]|nr:HAD family hydrolase [Bryobacteraceae bacterium]
MITAKAAIFDIDGTLLDSVDMHAEAWRRAFREFGKIIPASRIRTQIGKGGDQLLPVFLGQDEQLAFAEELKNYRADLWKRDFMSEVKPFPHVRELFIALRDRRIRLALASSSKKDELEYYKRVLRIDDLIEANTSADDAERSKPHPDIFQAALARTGVRAEETIAVGDTPYDAQSAGGAGIRTVGVLCGGFAAAILRDAGCAAIYRNPAALMGSMDGWVHWNYGS